jgi:hypothetical protein
MPTLDGSHSPGSGGPAVQYRVDYEVVGRTINYRARFAAVGGPSTHEGQFDFDPARVDAKAAVEAFMHNHIAKADWDVAP